MRSCPVLFLLCCLGLGLSPSTQAQVPVEIWSISYTTPFSNLLVTFPAADPSSLSIVGFTGLSDDYSVEGLEFTSSDQLYALVEGPVNGIYQLDVNTGAATLIGPHGLGPETTVTGLSYDSTTDQLHASARTGDNLEIYVVDLATGAMTLSSSFPDTVVTHADLAFDGCGTLFLTDGIHNRMNRVCNDLIAEYPPTGVATWGSNTITVDWNGSGAWYHGYTVTLGTFENAGRFGTVDPLTGATNEVGIIGDGDEPFFPQAIAIRPTTAAQLCVTDPDCDGSGVPDPCEIVTGVLDDCDDNGFPDECDVAGGASDCDTDGVLDRCQFYEYGEYGFLSGMGDLAVADFDGDGLLDAAVANSGFEGQVVILSGVPGGGFVTSAGGIDPLPLVKGLQAGDLDGDGTMDLVVSQVLPNTLRMFLGQGDGTFVLSVEASIFIGGSDLAEIRLADFNNDGALDVYVKGSRMVLGDGNGGILESFSVPNGQGPPAIGDFDEDGVLDIGFGNTTSIALWFGDGTGDFPEGITISDPFPGNFRLMATGDLDGDGHLDLAALKTNDTLSVWKGDGSGAFEGPTSSPSEKASELVIGDIDGDGTSEIISAVRFFIVQGPFWNRLYVHWLNGTMVTHRDTLEVGHSPTDLLVADSDGDGENEILLCQGTDRTLRVVEFLDQDCNFNDVLDSCDIASGASSDDNQDGIPDECQPAGILATLESPDTGKTYHLLDVSPWERAQAFAETLGGHLVTVASPGENQLLLDAFGNFGGEERNLWIGYHDTLQEGSFEWISGAPVGYENWSPLQPDDDGGQDHAALRPVLGGAWTDESNGGVVSEPFHGVVEIPLTVFIRGDADGDGVFNGIIDGFYILTHQFSGGPPPPCFESGDSDADGAFNGLSDGLYVLTHAFLAGPPPPPPYPTCGVDPDPATTIGCLEHPGCP